MRKHVAKIKAIWPENENLLTIPKGKAYCGVSLSNPNYSGKRLKAVVQFLLDYFDDVLMVTSGYLYRYHYQLTERSGNAMTTALKKESDYIENHLKPTLDEIDSKQIIKILKWGDIYDKESFKVSLSEVDEFYNNNDEFSTKIRDIAEQFIDKQVGLGVNLAYPRSEAVNLSIQFLLEETAMFNHLALNGYIIDVYPGTNVTALRNINLHQNAPSGLKQRKSIELRIERLGRKSEKEKQAMVTYE